MGAGSSEVLLPWANQTVQALQFRFDGLEVEAVPVGTAGDRQATDGLAAVSEGQATQETDAALLAGAIDFSVHRAQDLPVEIADGLCVAAFCKREDPREVFVPRDGLFSWSGFGSGKVAVSSLRRGFQIKWARPGVEPVPLAGAVSARLSRLKEGFCDALVLSGADWVSLDLPPDGVEAIPVEDLVPAPGQGALVLQTRLDRKDVREVLRGLDDPICRLELEFERALLRSLGPDHAPVLGVLARSTEEGVGLSVFHCRPDGSKPMRLRRYCAGLAERDGFIAELVDFIRRSG